MHVLAAPDKFRGTATAGEVCAAVSSAAEALGHTCTRLPLADGGEGTLEAFGGPNRSTRVTGPLGDQVDAEWRLDGTRAVIEMSRASGLALAGGEQGNDPVSATTRGTGELIAAAIAEGARTVIVGVGGSATTDGGLGAVEVLAPFRADVLVCCDVQTEFVAAAKVFGPQKGAGPAQVTELADRLLSIAATYRDRFGVDVEHLPGSGAAGGLAGGLAALGARLTPGFALIAEELGLDEQIRRADLVVTGEGRLDAESFNGKVVGQVISMAAGRPVLAAVGSRVAEVDTPAAVVSLEERFGSDAAFAETTRCVREAVSHWLQEVNR